AALPRVPLDRRLGPESRDGVAPVLAAPIDIAVHDDGPSHGLRERREIDPVALENPAVAGPPHTNDGRECQREQGTRGHERDEADPPGHLSSSGLRSFSIWPLPGRPRTFPSRSISTCVGKAVMP